MSNSKPKVGLVGYGYWGPNLLRNLVTNGGAEVIGVVEMSADARKRVTQLYPQIPVFSDLGEFLKSQKPDAMVIATPPATHRDLAIQCLKAGAHILVEKPLAMSQQECDDVMEASRKYKRQVMVDHTFVYNPAVEYMNGLIRKGDLGDVLYYDSVRVNLGGFQPRTNALWDLAPHDLSILDLFLGGKLPVEVTSVGIRHFNTDVENLCYLHLKYDNNCVAHLHLNWVAPVKIRTVMVGGSKKMAIYDENNMSERIKVYDRGVSVTPQLQTQGDFRVSYRSGDMIAPAISNKEALAGMIGQFLKMVTQGEKPASDGDAGRRVVQILEAASMSMSASGKPIFLGSEGTYREPRFKAAA